MGWTSALRPDVTDCLHRTLHGVNTHRSLQGDRQCSRETAQLARKPRQRIARFT